MTTLIFGGTGFIGSRIARKLVDRGEQVVCVDVVPDAPAVAKLRDKVTILRGDVTRLEDVLAPMKAHQVDRVINLAYLLTSDSEQNAHLAVQVNAVGMSNVFEAARLLDLKRVVYASSIAVYGDQSAYGDRPIREDDLPSPRTLYGASKLLNDIEAANYSRAYSLSLVGIRISSVYGHGRLRGRSAWGGTFASFPAVGKPVEFPYPAEMRWSMIYVEDAAELFVRALLAPKPAHAIYNSGGDNVSLGELAAAVRQEIPDAKHTFTDVQSQTYYMIDGTRAESEFGWQRTPLAQAVKAHIAEARAAG
ncbi:MAG: NAD(P)-dependent oxidoreductase [Chloroflexi bacterium]|nr:NAD(P)-dependent oxidoreductase [Chloroflexota bacterium]